MDLMKFIHLLENRALYFCRADKFSDPLEGTLSIEGVHGTSPTDRAFAETIRIKSENYAEKAAYRQIAQQCTFINCWHIANYENPEMWTVYTSSPSSLAIHTTAIALKNAVGPNVFMSGVVYLDEKMPRTELDEISLFFFKDKQFVFENELRLLTDLMRLGGSSNSDDPKDFFRLIPVNLTELIQEIRLHPQCSDSVREKLQSEIKTRGLSVPVNQMRQ